MRRIYLDFNATTPVAPSVLEAMQPFLAEHYGNPSSSHALGRICHEALEDARMQLAALLGAERDEIVFTSGGTESNNLALFGLLLHDPPRVAGHLVISSFEHPAIAEPARYLGRFGGRVTIVPCSRHGIVEPAAVEAALEDDTVLVSIMHANNEIGTIQPIREIAAVCHARNVLVHTDAAQTVGKVRVNVGELGVDLLTVAGHKFYAPKGVGALYIRRGVAVEPLLHGGGHEGGLRPGTENVASIVGLGRAARLVARGLDDAAAQLARLRDRLEQHLLTAIGAQVSVNGYPSPRLPNTTSVNFPRVSAADLLVRIPELCASTGSACHTGAMTGSATLAALGLRPEVARGTVRLSLGWTTSEEDIDRAASLLIGAWEALQR